jgi:hypothetical protein
MSTTTVAVTPRVTRRIRVRGQGGWCSSALRRKSLYLQQEIWMNVRVLDIEGCRHFSSTIMRIVFLEEERMGVHGCRRAMQLIGVRKNLMSKG